MLKSQYKAFNFEFRGYQRFPYHKVSNLEGIGSPAKRSFSLSIPVHLRANFRASRAAEVKIRQILGFSLSKMAEK
jgi:hypothetical protein